MGNTDDGDESGTGSDGGLGIGLGSGLRKLVELLESVDQTGEESGDGRVPGRTGSIDYSYTARAIDGDRVDDRSTSRPRTVRRRHSTEVPVRIDREGDDIILVVDVSDADREDLTVGVDESAEELVVGLSDEAIERVPIDGTTASVVDVTENNQVLEIRVRPGGRADE